MIKNTHSLDKQCEQLTDTHSKINKKQKTKFIDVSQSFNSNDNEFSINHRPSLTFSLLSNPDSLNIATHNIVTFRDNIKNDQILEHALINNIHILGVSETNIPFRQICFIKKGLNSKYSYYFNSNKQHSKGNGVGILIHESISDHVFYSYGKDGRYIFIDL